MDAGVLGRPPQVQFFTPDGSAPLIYGSNGQFQMSAGGSSVDQGPNDTGGSGNEAFVSDMSSAQVTGVVTSTQGSRSPLTTTTRSFKVSSQTLTLIGTSTERATRVSSTYSFPSFSRSSVSVSSSTTVPRSSACVFGQLGYACSSSTLLANSTASSTANSRTRTISPVVPIKVSNLGVQPSSWYLAVIFGSIAGVAFLIFLVGIVVSSCRKTKRHRMAQNIDVPWAARPGDAEEGLLFFGSRSASSRGANAAIHSGHRRNMFRGQMSTHDLQPGRPSQAAGFRANELRTRYSLHDHPIPGSRLFSDEPFPATSKERQLGHHLRPINTLRFLPSHLIDKDLVARAIQEDRVYASIASRPTQLRKRSRGHLDDVNPYLTPISDLCSKNEPITTSAALTHEPLVHRLRNLGDHDREHARFWDRLPTPGRNQPEEESEPWASSFKASIFTAFNAFTSGLKPNDSSWQHEPDGDRLTKVPKRRKLSIRRSYLQSFSRKKSTKSPGWILHERDDGSGTVQFLPSLEKEYGSSPPTPGKLLPVFSSDSGVSSSDDDKADFQKTEQPVYPRAPLLPATVHTLREKDSFSLTRPDISRDSSIYSISSSKSGDLLSTSLHDGRLADIPVLDQNV